MNPVCILSWQSVLWFDPERLEPPGCFPATTRLLCGEPTRLPEPLNEGITDLNEEQRTMNDARPTNTPRVSALAGKPAPASLRVDVAQLLAAYGALRPDAHEPSQRVSFGTSGHRGCALHCSFNDWHVAAITQAICEYRHSQHIDGPLYLGIDTHALSQPAFETALEVLAANAVTTRLSLGTPFTPTPALSHAILVHNRGRSAGWADGIVITPSHNPPEDGGFKYNPPHGGPADKEVTDWIETRANALLVSRLAGVKRIPLAQALHASTTQYHDIMGQYVADLETLLDMQALRASGIRLGVDPLGGAGVHYWPAIAEHYGLNLTVVNPAVDPTFGFMSVDWDGRIRMDPSSAYAMQGLIGLKDRFDIAFGCDPDHDRHGIVTPSGGLMAPNHYLSVAIAHLFAHRPQWPERAGVGKTLVSSRMIDRVSTHLGRPLTEVPVGFKWFVEGLMNGSLAFAGEESAGATFVRRDGRVWTTDKDGIALALLSAEITALQGRDPSALYQDLTLSFGNPVYDRIDAPATVAQKKILGNLSAQQITSTELAGETITGLLTRAPGNQAPIGGLKVETASGWFAARPSGTENLYKIYAESFRDRAHLQRLLTEAQALVDTALATAPGSS